MTIAKGQRRFRHNVAQQKIVGPGGQLFVMVRGVVEFNADPLGLKRCKVRVPTLHGFADEGRMTTEDLKWAIPGVCAPSGNDFGEFLVPPVGTAVMVLFEAGNQENIVYMGANISIQEVDDVTYLATDDLPETEGDMIGENRTPWHAPVGQDAPEETNRNKNFVPSTLVLYKSPKGALFLIDDRDEAEAVEILDRLGQGLKVSGRISTVANTGNAFRRHDAEIPNYAGKEGAFGPKLPLQGGEVLLFDFLGQEISLRSFTGNRGLEIVLREPNGNQELLIHANLSRGEFRIENTLQGVQQFGIRADANRMRLAATEVTIVGERTTLEGDVAVRGNVYVDGDVRGTGDLMVHGEMHGH